MTSSQAKFAVGQIVLHLMFGYRGVIIDVDPNFAGSDEWYTKMVSGQPAKDKPWYHILVHGSVHRAYAAENQLELDPIADSIEHPELEEYFDNFENGVYQRRRSTN